MRSLLVAVACLFFQIVHADDIPILTPEFPTTFDQAKYDKLYPLSVKFCTMTALQRVGEKFGGPFAHAVLYFRNACIDTDYKYPQIRKCNPGEDVGGVGVSVNKVYKNSNWVAIPGRKLFFYGDLEANEEVSLANKEALMSKVEGMNIYQGIVYKDKTLYKQQPGESDTHYKINQSLDTDFAINWGHSLYCVNIPLNEALLNKGIEFVNVANIAHADGQRLKDYKLKYVLDEDMKATGTVDEKAKEQGLAKDYNWTGLGENCAHLAFNMFSAMGLIAPKKVRRGWLPFRWAVPTDRWVHLIKTANASWNPAMYEAYDVWSDKKRKLHLLNEHGVLLKHHGVVAEFIPAHTERNGLFKNQEFLASMNPFQFGKVFQYAHSRPENIYDMEANLNHFEEIYTSILAEPADLLSVARADSARRKHLESEADQISFARTAAKYRAAVQNQLNEVKAKQELLKSGN